MLDLKLRTHQVMLEMVAAGHGFHPCLSSFLRKPFVKFCRGAGGAVFVVGLFFSFVSFLVQMDIFFLRTKEKMCVCVCVCFWKSICIFLCIVSCHCRARSLSNLLTQIVNLNEFVTCIGKEMPVQRVGNIFFC